MKAILWDAAQILWLLLLAMLLAFGFDYGARGAEIAPGVVVEGIELDGASREANRQKLAEWAEKAVSQPVLIHLNDGDINIIPREFGVEPRVDETLEAAYQVGRTGLLPEQIWRRYIVSRQGFSISFVFSIEKELYEPAMVRLARKVLRPPVDARFEITADERVKIIPAKPGQRLWEEKFVESLLSATRSLADQREMELPMQEILPSFTTEQAKSLGIEEKVAEFTTYYNPTEKDRSNNVVIAAEALNGLIIRQGELFSFNDVVGPRSNEKGYKEAPIFVNNKLVPGVGGGVCQVSTTLFNLALLANLKIEEQMPHSRPVAYVPLGRDATVSYGYIDLKFRNTTKGNLYLRSIVGGGKLTLQFYGDKQYHPPVELFTTDLVPIPPKVVYEKRPDLTKGATLTFEGKPGYTVKLWRVVKGDGSEQKELIGHLSYNCQDTVVYVGVKQ